MRKAMKITSPIQQVLTKDQNAFYSQCVLISQGRVSVPTLSWEPEDEEIYTQGVSSDAGLEPKCVWLQSHCF